MSDRKNCCCGDGRICPSNGDTTPAERPSELASATGSAQTTTFIAELSDTKFELTEAEKQHLDDLLAWQERSAKSLIQLGGTGEAPNDPSSATRPAETHK